MEINGKNNPLELGLKDLIDFNKGCYLGQETMSKIKNVSSLKQPIFFKTEDKEFEIYKNKLNLLNPNDVKLWKINQAIPSLEMEINGKNNPLELGLQDLIDFNKGCYLGQETMSKIKNVSSLKQEIRIWKSIESNLNLDLQDKNLYINSAKDISVGKITSFLKSDSKIKGLAMIKRKYLEEGSYFFSEIFGKIIINKSVGSIFL